MTKVTIEAAVGIIITILVILLLWVLSVLQNTQLKLSRAESDLKFKADMAELYEKKYRSEVAYSDLVKRSLQIEMRRDHNK